MVKNLPFSSLSLSLSRYKGHGFTLIEVSVVLVIVGLIIGGVMLAQDMIRAAQLRSTLGQREEFLAAKTTFQVKYNHLPGDIPPTNASQFGFPSRNPSSSYGYTDNGDGDRILEGGTEWYGQYSQSSENTMFWVDLSASGLIGETLNSASGSAYSIPASEVGDYFPRTKLSKTTYWMVGSDSGRNVFILSNYMYGVSANTATGTVNSYHYSFDLDGEKAFQIDTKLDDGLPLTGMVVARSSGHGTGVTTFHQPAMAHANTTFCVNASSEYRISTANHCVLILQMK